MQTSKLSKPLKHAKHLKIPQSPTLSRLIFFIKPNYLFLAHFQKYDSLFIWKIFL